jgi:hypothetical protein
VLCLTTITAAAATVEAIRALRERAVSADVVSLQELHADRMDESVPVGDLHEAIAGDEH